MRCIILRRFLLALGLCALCALPLCAQTGQSAAPGGDTVARVQHPADTTRSDSTGFVHWMYGNIQSAYKFLRRAADPVMRFFERLWHAITKETSDRDSILRFPLGHRKS
jgi:hypothetical protein